MEEEEKWDGPKIGKEQAKDPMLKAVWNQAKEGKREGQEGTWFELYKGVMYRRGQDPCSGEVDQLVLPTRL